MPRQKAAVKGIVSSTATGPVALPAPTPPPPPADPVVPRSRVADLTNAVDAQTVVLAALVEELRGLRAELAEQRAPRAYSPQTFRDRVFGPG